MPPACWFIVSAFSLCDIESEGNLAIALTPIYILRNYSSLLQLSFAIRW